MFPKGAVGVGALLLCASCDGAGTPPEVPVDKAMLAVTPPGTPLGSPIEGALDAMGGQLASSDGRLTVDVPAGALAGPQRLTLQEVTSGSPGALGVTYRLGPEGQTFAKPVKLTFKYEKADLSGSEAVALHVAYQDPEGRWNSLKSYTLDEKASTIAVETSHFSDWALYAGWKLTPASASSRPNAFTALQVKVCAAKDPGSQWLAALIYTCTPDPDFFTVSEWAVNGIRQGSSETGTVAGGAEGTAQYLAPGRAPPVNPVAVSAEVVEKSGRKTLLVSTIWVDAHPPLRGTVASLQTNPFNPGDFYATQATARFRWNSDFDQYESAGGTFFARHDTVSPGGADCAIHTSFEGMLGAMEGAIILQDNTYYPYGRSMGTFTGTSTCNGKHAPEPVSVLDDANWSPAPQMTGNVVKDDGSMAEQLTGVTVNGKKVNVVWTFSPETN